MIWSGKLIKFPRAISDKIIITRNLNRRPNDRSLSRPNKTLKWEKKTRKFFFAIEWNERKSKKTSSCTFHLANLITWKSLILAPNVSICESGECSEEDVCSEQVKALFSNALAKKFPLSSYTIRICSYPCCKELELTVSVFSSLFFHFGWRSADATLGEARHTQKNEIKTWKLVPRRDMCSIAFLSDWPTERSQDETDSFLCNEAKKKLFSFR